MKRLLTTKVMVSLLCLFSLQMLVASVYAQPFHFTITSDQRGGTDAVNQLLYFDRTLQSINTILGGPGVFHVSVGDIDYSATNPSSRTFINQRFGNNFPWVGVVGNHDAETDADMTWLRTEYTSGHDGRTPLKNIFTTNDGPTGSTETSYSWDYANAHFVVLNCYWDGVSDNNENGGDIIPALYNWLAADLAATNKPFIFIFVHEPAFPYNHHYGDSLDQFPTNRNNFWSLLESEKVTAVFVGHNHCAFLGQTQCNRPADPPPGARDQGDLPFEAHSSLLSTHDQCRRPSMIPSVGVPGVARWDPPRAIEQWEWRRVEDGDRS